MTTGGAADDARRAAMAASWRAVQLSGLVGEPAVRGALIAELRSRGVPDPTDPEISGLAALVRAPSPAAPRLLRDQVARRVRLFRGLASFREPTWSLPPNGVPSPPEPDLTSTEIAALLRPSDLVEGRDVLRRVIGVLGNHGDVEPERSLSPWLSLRPEGELGVHVGRERVAVLAGDRAQPLLDAIERWGRDTGTLSVHGTLHGDDVDAAQLRVFVSLPPDD